MNNRQTIDLFLKDKRLAIAGVSRNPQKFGYSVYHTLKDKGYSIVPVNPNAEKIDDINCLQSISQLDEDVKNLLIATNKRDTQKVLEEAISKGIRNIWIQNGCETEEAIEYAGKNNINLVSKACFLMYANPTGFHKFHQTITKWFGGYAKEIKE
jgi:predicted CoA-binding protein